MRGTATVPASGARFWTDEPRQEDGTYEYAPVYGIVRGSWLHKQRAEDKAEPWNADHPNRWFTVNHYGQEGEDYFELDPYLSTLPANGFGSWEEAVEQLKLQGKCLFLHLVNPYTLRPANVPAKA